MTLARRIIPSLLVRGRTLVKGKQFAGDRSIGHVQQAARVHARRGVDELLILDIGATAEGRGPDLQMVSELAADCYIPITVGGGVKSIEDIDALLRAGADKVAICTAAIEEPALIKKASSRFGAQAITVVMEVADSSVAWRCGASRSAWWPPTFALAMQHAGAGEIVVQSVERDGMMDGYDLDMIHQVSQAVDIPLIASGGCGTYQHMLEAFQAGADAVAAGAMFAFTDSTPKGAARYLQAHGIPVRL